MNMGGVGYVVEHWKRALGEIDTISQRTAGDRTIVVAYDNES